MKNKINSFFIFPSFSMMFLKKLHFLCILFVILLFLCSTTTINGQQYDTLMFVQQWPSTFCISENTCRLPSEKYTWTIHGIWPSRFDGRGPDSCNSDSKFDLNALDDLKDQLDQYWPSIESANSNGVFWQHEWKKHGTCVKLENLSTPSQYFAMGLHWLTKYDMFRVLAKNDILPGNEYKYLTIKRAIKRELGIEPTLRCARDKQTNEMYLKEIYICFNKGLQLIDCREDNNSCADVINYPNAQNDTTFSICIIYFVAVIAVCFIIYKYKKNQIDRNNFMA